MTSVLINPTDVGWLANFRWRRFAKNALSSIAHLIAFEKSSRFLVGASNCNFKAPCDWILDLIIRAERLECEVYRTLT